MLCWLAGWLVVVFSFFSLFFFWRGGVGLLFVVVRVVGDRGGFGGIFGPLSLSLSLSSGLVLLFLSRVLSALGPWVSLL